MIISVILRSGKLLRPKVLEAIRAINRQLAEDFEPYWGFGAQLRLEGTSDPASDPEKAVDMRGDGVLYIVDNRAGSDDALGFHDANYAGVPYGFILLEQCNALKEDWRLTLSHEALELVADPASNLLVKGPHPVERSRDVYHWFEMCDAVQGDGYRIDDVPVANFVLPLYFTPDSKPGGRNDFLGLTQGGELAPFGVRPGGYIGYYDPKSDTDEEHFADRRAMRRSEIKAKFGTGRSQFRMHGLDVESRSRFLQRAVPRRPIRKATPGSLARRTAAVAFPPGADPFRHVVLLALENRSFDHLLGDFSRVNPQCNGIAAPVRFNDVGAVGRIEQRPNLAMTFPSGVDPIHETPDVLKQIAAVNGNPMGAFGQNFADHYGGHLHGAALQSALAQVMGYYPFGVEPGNRDSLPALHTLARQFVVCDDWHASVPGPTWANRFFMLTGTSLGWVSMPTTGNPTPLFRNYSQDTLFDRLDSVRRRWRIYHDGIPQSITLSRLHARWDHYAGMGQFQQDAAGNEATFPDFAFIEPRYGGAQENSQHPPADMLAGERLIADVYNAIRANPALWTSTLLVITYDEHGGLYDHVTPVAATPPDGHADEYTFDRLGVRVPTVLVSPWLNAGLLKATYDHTSLLRYLADKWGFAPLGARAAEAKNFAGEWNLRAAVRDDTPAQLSVPIARGARRVAATMDQSVQLLGSRGALVMYVENCLPSLAGAPLAAGVRAARGRGAQRRLPKKSSNAARQAAAEAKALAFLRSGDNTAAASGMGTRPLRSRAKARRRQAVQRA